MRSISLKSTYLLLLVTFLMNGCKKDQPVLSNAKEVIGFSASNPGINFMPVRVNSNHSIVIEAICPTNQGAITVNPIVSPNAKCSLAAGTVLDLHQTKTFTVTAEDGSTLEYIIYVQGASLYSSHFYRSCNQKRIIDCITQDNRLPKLVGNSIYLYFNKLSDSTYPEDDFRVSLDLSDVSFKSGSFSPYFINPLLGKESKASFVFASNVFSRTSSPSGKITITYVDTVNKLFSGSFYFGQKSDDICASNTDYIAGEFYSVPF
jgi:Family of unknown function (DUF6252)